MRRSLAPVAVLVLLGALTGCGPLVQSLPEGLSIVVYQPRPDVAAGRFALQVVNAGDTDVEILDARLNSPDFTTEVAWGGDGSTVLAGRSVDLRVPLPEIDCAAETVPRAWLVARTETGSTPSTEVDVADPFDLLPRLHAEQCVGQAIAEIATLTPREVIVPGGREPAVLVVDVEPTGATGSVEIVGVRGTTLVQPAADGVATTELALDATLSESGPRELRVPLLPNRCDAHALAEDKVGTIIPFLVDVGDDEPVRWLLVLPDEQRAALYGYYAAYCGLPTP